MKRVLVVDDEPTIREVIRDVLIDEGYEVIIVSDGRDAIALLDDVRPDVVVMDVMMPGLDGREAFLAIRSRPEHASVPIIMMSAAITPAQLNEGIAAFLPKPFDLDEMIATVRHVLDGA